ncbi:MAG TPA: CotH kinase family protein [Dehalococcoidia bacterium]|nr:CotH kinase family protein [Dehalococcoidia bacterium]
MEEPGRPEGWTTETHSKAADPNHDEVFSDTEVKRIDIVFSADEWDTMMADMTEIYGEPDGGGPGGPPPPPPDGGGPGGPPPPPPDGGGPGGPPPPPPGGFSDQDPVFVPAEIHYGDKTWTNVGVRFKGSSSLLSPWSSGNLKLSFKLDFDEFEDTFPEIDNQRFFGFKKLSLKNNFDDPSFVREKVMADVFADAGMVVSRTAFYAVYVDRGEGPEYFGLYTMVEEVNDTVLDTQYGNDDGNIYKPDGPSTQFSAESFDEAEMVKQNNKTEADFSDVQALLAALHDDTRTTDPATWRQGLDAVFDTDVFLQYLAVNGIGQNWDTYGRMTHNYYLYNRPETSRLTWIPWDNNEALQTGKSGGALPLDFAGLQTATWPLIGFLYADPVYRATYEEYLQQTIDDAFTVAGMHARYDAYQTLIEPYATTERPGFTFLNNAAAFDSAFTTLRNHAESRVAATQSYLSQ